ncbi:hypothetical protein [Luteibacter sp.]|uniref:hypothetical protein n=1 Tax=Luteibacter sp. TaxID=1886636 RepID=UPI003F7E324B
MLPSKIPPWATNDLARRLIEGGYLVDGTPAGDVAREVIEVGEEALSAQSRRIYERSLLLAMRALANGEPRLRILEFLMRDS